MEIKFDCSVNEINYQALDQLAKDLKNTITLTIDSPNVEKALKNYFFEKHKDEIIECEKKAYEGGRLNGAVYGSGHSPTFEAWKAQQKGEDK